MQSDGMSMGIPRINTSPRDLIYRVVALMTFGIRFLTESLLSLQHRGGFRLSKKNTERRF